MGNLHITQSDHADRLPNAETNSRSNATVKTLQPVVRVNVFRRLADRQVLGAVRVHSLGLHLNSDNLDGLVPSTQSTTERRCDDLLGDAKLLALLLASDPPDTGFCDTRETEARAPVGHLADRDGVHTTVDTADTFLAPDFHKCLHGTRGLHASRGDLVLRDLDGLHAGAETHGGIGLRETSDHTARDTCDEVRGTEAFGVKLSLGSNKEKDSALGGCLDPSPGDETLVDCVTHLLASLPCRDALIAAD